MQSLFGTELSTDQVAFWKRRFTQARLPMAAVADFQNEFHVSLFQAFWTYKTLTH